MSKLSKLKKYFSISDTAKYLSNALEEPVSVADIYELAIEGKLKISARLIDRTYAISTQLAEEDNKQSGGLIKLPDGKRLALNEQIQVIDGIWELAMIGMELHKIKELYQEAIGGPSPQINVLNGFYLQEGERIYQIQSVLPLLSNEHNHAALEAKLDSLLKSKGLTARDILNGGNPHSLECLSDDELEEFMDLTFAQAQEESGDKEGGCNYLSLEEHSYQFVIRTDELTRFVKSLDEEHMVSTQTDKPLGSKERNTLLSLIGALLKEQRIEPSDRGVTSAIRVMTENTGMPISENTIRKILNQVSDITA